MSDSFEHPFAAALLDPERPVPAGVTAHNIAVPARRYAVYRNNVVASLMAALRSRFPAVESIVGEEFFAGLARRFVIAEPPRSPLLVTYGDAFAEFLEGFAPARELPYLADIARLEAARTRAYHAADAVPVDAARFAALDGALVETIRIDLHPSVEIVRSAFPVVTIWAMNCGERELAPIDDWRGEDALVARPHLEVEVRALPPGGAAFLRALAAALPLGEAAQKALDEDGAFDLTVNLAGLIGAGLVRDIIVPASAVADSAVADSASRQPD
jgi:hypothetical protein